MIKRIKVMFVKDIRLPRFTMKEGEFWEVRPDRLKEDGFELGGGFVENDGYKLVSLIHGSLT